MPVTDPAGTRARTDMLAHGWPDYLLWDPAPDLVASLDELTVVRRAALRYEWRGVTDPAPHAVALTYEALRRALVNAGLPDQLAEFAADFTRLVELGGIVDVVRWTAIPKPPGWGPGQESPAS